MAGKLLFVDDDAAVRDVIQATLSKRAFEVTCCASGEEALRVLASGVHDVIVTDLQMPGMDGATFCRRARAGWPELPVIVVTAFGSVETAVSAIRAGAYDFIAKPIQLDELLLTLDRALEKTKLRRENKRLRAAIARYDGPPNMLGESPVMQELYLLLQRIESSTASVLITGESGTGKELIANALHARGPHASGPFVAINCAAVPAGVLESELFGHVRGAFTDAVCARTGLFLQASGGTLFLDEIGELPLPTQVKLLRALQERKVRPVGGDRELSFDARILTATNRDLEVEVEEQRFREDLYYRINVLRVEVPPLRARGTDILRIAEHYVSVFATRAKKQITGITRPAAELLLGYSWPGNVRELQNCMERAVALTAFERIVPEDLPVKLQRRGPAAVAPAEGEPELLSIAELEKRHILQVLHRLNGSKSHAADVLGLDRRTLYRKLKHYAAE